jgi:subtilisin family serine protease
MTRTRTLATLLVVATLCTQLAIAPVAAGPLTQDTSMPSVVKSDGLPTYVVSLSSPDSASTLEDWAAAHNDRAILSTSGNGSFATIRAPRWQVNQGLLDRVTSLSWNADIVQQLTANPLTERSYITSISPNYRLQNTEPVPQSAFPNASALAKPTAGLTSLNDPARPTEGVAANGDTEPTTMQDSRHILGVNNVSSNVTGEGVTVAVIDSGVNTAGGDLFGENESSSSPDRVSPASKNFITNETVADVGIDAVEDGSGHGTWVASSIAANATNDTHDGIAPEAHVLALKALDDEGSGSTANIARAIRYAADNGADVITMSLGSPVYSPALADSIQYAQDNGVQAITVATGNSRQTTRWMASPSDVDGVIAVAATNGSAPATAGSAYFSQIGPDPSTLDGSSLESQGEQPDIAAPGMQTVALTADTSGFTSTHTLSGTSMATPMVAGTIALAIDEHPSWSADTVREKVPSTARRIPHAASVEVGSGMVAADRLVANTATDRTQADAMTDAARTRGEFYRALSDASGGLLTRLLNGGSIL